jgi:hypothetical protein
METKSELFPQAASLNKTKAKTIEDFRLKRQNVIAFCFNVRFLIFASMWATVQKKDQTGEGKYVQT